MIVVNTNMSSLSSRSHLDASVKSESRSAEKLSSGLRINSARDDAAGLSIATRMSAKVHGANKAIQSNMQSISLLQTGEGVLQEQTSMLQRMRELTIQSLNGSNQDRDRSSLQAEVSELKQQFDQAAQLKFNAKKIFDQDFQLFTDGDLSKASLQSMFITSKNADRVARQSINTSRTGVSNEVLNTGEITIRSRDGEMLQVRGTSDADDTLSTTNNAASAIAKAHVINLHSEKTGVTAVVGKTQITGGFAIRATTLDEASYLSINNIQISGFQVEESDATGVLVDAINAEFDKTGVRAHLSASSELVLVAEDGRNIDVEAIGDASDLGFGVQTVVGGSLTLRSSEAYGWSYGDSFVDAKLGYIFSDTIELRPGTASISFSISGSAGWQFISENAGANYVAPDWQGHLNNNIVLSGNYSGDIASAVGNRFHVEVYNGGTTGGSSDVWLGAHAGEDSNGESLINYIANTPFDPSGAGTYIFASPDVTLPSAPIVGSIMNTLEGSGNLFIFQFLGANLVDDDDITDGDGLDAFQFTANVGALNRTDFIIGLGFDETVDTIDISTVEAARRSLFTIDLAIEELSTERSQFGAMINCFESSIRSLEEEKVNLSASRSRIQDTDFAQETVVITRAQINKQAGVSVLAQANTQASLALSLIG